MEQVRQGQQQQMMTDIVKGVRKKIQTVSDVTNNRVEWNILYKNYFSAAFREKKII